MPVEEKTNEFYTDTRINPVGTAGFAFLEFAAPNPEQLRTLFTEMNFVHIANHQQKAVELWRQGNVNFLINKEPDSFSANFIKLHGPCVSGMAFYVKNHQEALKHCVERDAKPYQKQSSDWHEEDISVIYGIGDNLLYLVDSHQKDTFFEKHFDTLPDVTVNTNESALQIIDHVTHNVFRGNMNKWAQFYEKLFNFREIRYFDIEGKLTGLISRAMTSPCGKIRIPINESSDDKSQIEEYLQEYKGEGIQHIALTTNNIYATVENLRSNNVDFFKTPDSYYRGVDDRVPHHSEPLERMQKNQILIDGAPTKDGGYLLQIFTNTVIGPVFFEIIQRKGDEGFGEGNFKALFESMELDQIERGVLSAEDK